MSSNDSSSQAARQQFLFVDVNDPEQTSKTKTQIRSHLMHTAFRRRRIQRTKLQHSNAPFPTQPVSNALHDISPSDPHLFTASIVTRPKPPVRRKKPSKAHDISSSKEYGEASSADAAAEDLESPLSILSTLRRDSLSACPLKLDDDGHVLVDIWLTHFQKMAHLSLCPDIEAIYKPTCSLFLPLAMSSPASFQTTVLYFAALHRANVRGITNDRNLILHRTKSLHLIQGGIHSTNTTDDDLIAVLSLGTAETMLGDQAAAKIHMNGVRQLLRGRRQSGQVPSNPKLELLFSWYNINTPLSAYRGARTSPQVYDELNDDFNLFITMLSNFREIAVAHCNSPFHTKQVAPRLPSPSRLNSALCKILAPPSANSPFYTDFSSQMCRFFVLLQIHMALYFFRDNLEQAGSYLKHLTLRTIEMDLEYRTNSVFLLAWLIVSDSNLHNSLRFWVASRISVMFKELSWETRHRLNAHLLALLELAEDEKGRKTISSFDSNQLEAEVMNFEPPSPSRIRKTAAGAGRATMSHEQLVDSMAFF